MLHTLYSTPTSVELESFFDMLFKPASVQKAEYKLKSDSRISLYNCIIFPFSPTQLFHIPLIALFKIHGLFFSLMVVTYMRACIKQGQ